MVDHANKERNKSSAMTVKTVLIVRSLEDSLAHRPGSYGRVPP